MWNAQAIPGKLRCMFRAVLQLLELGHTPVVCLPLLCKRISLV